MGPTVSDQRAVTTTPVTVFEPRTPEPTEAAELGTYTLQPSQSLPTIDLARTLQSEFFSPRVNRVYRAIRRHRAFLVLAYVATLSSYVIALVVPVAVGGYVALLGVLVGLPGNFVVLGQLRYDLLKLLAHTFDVWFASITLLFVFTILVAMLHDARGTIAISFWIGSWPSICHDAVIVAIRPVVVFNAICVFICAFIVVGVNCNTIDRLRDFRVLEYGDNVLSAKTVVTEGFITIAAIMLRNTYRRRTIFQRRHRSSDLDCVIYRCRLQLVRQQRPPHDVVIQAGTKKIDASGIKANNHKQTMRFMPVLESIDPRSTVSPLAFAFVSAADAQAGRLWPALACCTVLLTLATVGTMVFDEDVTQPQTAIATAAAALTAVNSAISFLLFQRQLLRLISTSFDFIFLSVQLTILHICACDLFDWRRTSTLLAAVSWQWIHWVLLHDALTPPVRRSLRIHRHCPRFIFGGSTCAACLLVYMMIFAKNPAQTIDRVIWAAQLMGHEVSLRVLPQFFSSLAVVFVLILRYMWRQVTYADTDLVVIDGAVVFHNSFDRPRPRVVQIQPDQSNLREPFTR